MCNWPYFLAITKRRRGGKWMGRPIVKLENVSFRYQPNTEYALKNVSFHVYEGEWLAIVGHNGSGKSTIAKLMNGLQFAEEGKVIVGNIEVNEKNVWAVRKKIGMVFQNPDNQFVGTTVQDDVAFGLENHGIPREEMVIRVNEALKSVKMDAFMTQEPHQLSGGQKQRVAIAGVLALQPEIIVLDEATSMLDPRGREEVLHTIRTLKSNKKLTIISITHDLDEAMRADRLIVMKRGELYKEGRPHEIFQLGDQLHDLGLDLPFTIKFANALREKGIQIPKEILHEEELVRYLWTLSSKM